VPGELMGYILVLRVTKSKHFKQKLDHQLPAPALGQEEQREGSHDGPS